MVCTGVDRHGAQLQDGGLHSGQWQIIPSLPLVLALGASGQGQSSHGGRAMDVALTYDVGKMIATQVTAAKTMNVFMVAIVYFLLSKKYEDFESLITKHSIQYSFVQFLCENSCCVCYFYF